MLKKLGGALKPGTPVVAISGGGEVLRAEVALQMSDLIGADATLPKPVDAAVLLATINHALKRGQPN